MIRKPVAVTILAFIAIVVTATGASAHAQLRSSSPRAGARLSRVPTTVTLRFDDPVTLDDASVSAATSSRAVALTNLRFGADQTELVGDVPSTLHERGTIVFRWTVFALDGHSSSGSLPVGIGVAASSLGRSAVPDTHAIDRLFTLDRLVGYAAMSLLVGAWIFLVVVWPEGGAAFRTRLIMWVCVGTGLLSSAAGIVLEAATRSRRLSAAFEGDAIRAALDGPFGRAWTARGLLFVMAVPLVFAVARHGRTMVRSPYWIVAASACGVGLLRTPGFVSHASEGNISVLGSVADLVHLAGVAAWLGGLVMLATVVLPRRRATELAAVVPRYSKLAFSSIAAIVVAGSVMSWELVGSFTSFADTRFGHLLALKLLLFVFVMGAAFSSKRWVDQRLSVAVTLRGHASLVRPFVVSVATEAVLATGILAVASVLVATSPAR